MKKFNNSHDSNSSSRYGFEIIFKDDEKYYFQFNDTKGEPLLFSKGYNSEKSCADGIQAAIRAAGIDEQYDLNETKNEKYFFILKSGNNKEIGRSRMFDTIEELEEQIEILKDLDEDVPQYGLMDTSSEMNDESPEEKAMNTSSETKYKAREENAKAADSLGKKAKTPDLADKQPSQPEDVEKMPRYKFSFIYYPDSKVWMIKNDFSGDSTKMKTCDGQQIENFIKTQLPAEELEAQKSSAKPKEAVIKEEPAQPQQPIQEEPATLQSIAQPKEAVIKEEPAQPQQPIQEEPATLQSIAQPKEAVIKEKPAQPKQPIWEENEIELKIRSVQNELMQKVAEKARINKVELIIPKLSGDVQPQAFEAMVKAKSIRNNQTTLIGIAKKQNLIDGRLEVFISSVNSLQAGQYIFIANVLQNKQGEQPSTYYGSQSVTLY